MVGSVLAAVLVLGLSRRCCVSASCSRLCCPGTDLTCTSLGWRTDRTYGTCYCDHSCTRTRDCCYDHTAHCSGQPCVLSEWTQWSGCVRSCEPSYRVRRRSVEAGSRGSGQECPALEQRAGCMEYRNPDGQNCGQDRGPALITTVEYDKAREHSQHMASPDAGFCVEFELLSVSRWCMEEQRSYSRWMQYLREGFVVCVSCQHPAIPNPNPNPNHNHSCQGDGQSAQTQQVLRWQAVGTSHCRGTWRKIQTLHHCSCPRVHTFIFI